MREVASDRVRERDRKANRDADSGELGRKLWYTGCSIWCCKHREVVLCREKVVLGKAIFLKLTKEQICITKLYSVSSEARVTAASVSVIGKGIPLSSRDSGTTEPLPDVCSAEAQ